MEKGVTILEAAKKVDIEIPTLCHHQGLEPYGACRICIVEIIKKSGRSQTVAACSFPVVEGLKIKTRSPKIDKIRRTILELASASAGENVGKLRAMASEYNADLSRFRSIITVEPTKCILCGICVRRCIEANGDGAIGFISRGINRRIVRFPENDKLCSNCNYCYKSCPTGRITSTYTSPRFPYIGDVFAGRK